MGEGTCSATLSRRGGKRWVSIICRRQATEIAVVSAIPTRSSPLFSDENAKKIPHYCVGFSFGMGEGT